MVCIYCGSATQVVNSRLQRRSNHIWRRRRCLSCLSIFTTEEHAELSGAIMVQYSSKSLRPFSRDQLFISIYESCKHRDSALRDATALTLIIIGSLLKHTRTGLLHREDIVKTAYVALTRFDAAAATYYHAYHPAHHE